MELHVLYVNYMLMLTFNLNKQGFSGLLLKFLDNFSLHIKKLQRDMHMSAMLLCSCLYYFVIYVNIKRFNQLIGVWMI